MGRVAKRHQEEIESLASRVAQISDKGGDDAEIQSILLPHISKVEKRVATGDMGSTTFLKSYMPALWKEVGAAMGATAASARIRLFTYDIANRTPLVIAETVKGRRQEDNANYEKQLTGKLVTKCPFNEEVWLDVRDIAEQWLVKGGDSENDRMSRLILAISFFTGRRPWSETAFGGEFKVTSNPVRRDWKVDLKTANDYLTNFDLKSEPWDDASWSDGWLRFDGNAKRTKKEDVAGFSIPLDIPVIGIAPEDIVEAMAELRELQKNRSWYRPDLPAQEQTVQSALQANTKKAVGELDGVFESIYNKGHKFPPTGHGESTGRFAVYHLRPMWANRLGYEMRTITGKNIDQVVVSKWLLGHFGGLGKASMAYLSFDYLGDKRIPVA